MGKERVIELVRVLCGDLADAQLASQEYDLTLERLAEAGLRVKAEVLSLSVDQESFTLPNPAQRLIGAFYEKREMPIVDEQVIWAQAGRDWRARRGNPVAIVQVDRGTQREFRLYPKPTIATQFETEGLWAPLGRGYASGSLLLLTTNREEPIGEHFDLWLALTVVSKLMAAHTEWGDSDFAQFAAEWAKALEVRL